MQSACEILEKENESALRSILSCEKECVCAKEKLETNIYSLEQYNDELRNQLGSISASSSTYQQQCAEKEMSLQNAIKSKKDLQQTLASNRALVMQLHKKNIQNLESVLQQQNFLTKQHAYMSTCFNEVVAELGMYTFKRLPQHQFLLS